MYIGHASLCVCLQPHSHAILHGPDVTWENGRGCPLVMHYWADLQSVHGFCCYDNIVPCLLAVGAHDSIVANAKCQRVHAYTRCMPGYFKGAIWPNLCRKCC